VSVVLFTRQIRALDRLLKQVRKRTGAAVSRAAVIRALIDALHESRLDVTGIDSGTHLKQLIVQKLSR
jgi:broad specificity phosphatase PhoE